MTLTTPMKVILAIVLIGVIALGFWLLDWQKKVNDRQQLDQQIISKQQDYERIKEETRSLTALVQQNEQLQKEYQAVVQGRFRSNVAEAPEAFVPDFITKLETLVAQVSSEKNDDVEVNTISPGGAVTGPDPNKKKDEVPSIVQTTLERFPKRKFQLTMKARYDTVIYFLDKLGNLALDRLVTVDHLQLAPAGDAAKLAHPQLTVTLPLTAYLKTNGGQ